MIQNSSKLDGGKRERTRDALLAAAQEILLTQSASALSIKNVTARAGMVHATFYNHFDTLEALLDDVAALFFNAHSALVLKVRHSVSAPPALFARTTRQSLRVIADEPLYGRILFDCGLAPDRFVDGLRLAMRADIGAGVAQSVFKADNINRTASLIAGGILGLALDLYRQRLTAAAIEPATADLLRMLGLPRAQADNLCREPLGLTPPPRPPLGWLGVKTWAKAL